MASSTAPDLAESIVADGFDAHRLALSSLFADARRRGVSAVLIAVAADPGEPLVARQRALGQILAVMAGPSRGDAVLDTVPVVEAA